MPKKVASGRKSLRFPAAPPRARPWTSSCAICMRRLKAAFRSTSPRLRPAARSAFSKSPYEVAVRRDFARLRAPRLAVASHHTYGKPGNVIRLSVPIHSNRPLKTGLLRHLAKLAETDDDELR